MHIDLHLQKERKARRQIKLMQQMSKISGQNGEKNPNAMAVANYGDYSNAGYAAANPQYSYYDYMGYYNPYGTMSR